MESSFTAPSGKPPTVYVNPRANEGIPPAPADAAPRTFHRRLPEYEPTALIDLPELARELGIGSLLVKDESERFGLPAFKILGASYAIYRVVVERLGAEPVWETVEELRDKCKVLLPMTLSAATDGNHGRAVARMAALLGFEASIYVPEGTTTARIAAIESEGARVTVVQGDYDAAVRKSAEKEGPSRIIVSDTSWPGYEEIPKWVIDGYSTIFSEVADQLADRRQPTPDVIIIPVGVGSLAASAVNWFKDGTRQPVPHIVAVEPADANCVLESVRGGDLTTVAGPHRSIMAGLNTGTPSKVAWPVISWGLDVLVDIDDEWAKSAMRELAGVGLTAGETGAAALAGLLALVSGPDASSLRRACKLDSDTSVLLICTEGATDPAAYEQIVGVMPATA
jgi:diaminopropionate ammonia-lyase